VKWIAYHYESIHEKFDAIVVSNDGGRVISGSKDHTIGIWNTDYLAKAFINSFLGRWPTVCVWLDR
jgi:WD40 repeat protein